MAMTKRKVVEVRCLGPGPEHTFLTHRDRTGMPREHVCCECRKAMVKVPAIFIRAAEMRSLIDLTRTAAKGN